MFDVMLPGNLKPWLLVGQQVWAGVCHVKRFQIMHQVDAWTSDIHQCDGMQPKRRLKNSRIILELCTFLQQNISNKNVQQIVCFKIIFHLQCSSLRNNCTNHTCCCLRRGWWWIHLFLIYSLLPHTSTSDKLTGRCNSLIFLVEQQHRNPWCLYNAYNSQHMLRLVASVLRWRILIACVRVWICLNLERCRYVRRAYLPNRDVQTREHTHSRCSADYSTVVWRLQNIPWKTTIVHPW